MSDKLIKRIALEQEQLNRLIDTHRSLLAQCALQPPNDIELSALGFFLHSFYSGLENIVKRIAIEIDEGLPAGRSLASSTPGRHGGSQRGPNRRHFCGALRYSE